VLFVDFFLEAHERAPKEVVLDLDAQYADARARSERYQLDLIADRTSTAAIRADQLRLWFARWPMC
jgi:hypothetical protein